MSAGSAREDHLRVFLTADTPELLIHLHLLEEALAAVEEIPLEPVLLEPLAAAPVPLRTGSGREMREGDVLLALVFDPSKPSTQLAATLERAHQRQLLILPFHAAGGDIFAKAPPSPFVTLFDPTIEPAAVVRVVRATLLDVLSLVSSQTDLHGRWPNEKNRGLAALELLRAEPAQSDSQLGLAARESRQQAARAIEARLFEPALAALARALEYEATSAIGAFWRARLFAALGDSKRLIEARLEAARASRLAQVGGKQGEKLASAASWLQARLEAFSGEKDGLLEALADAGINPATPAGKLLPALHLLVLGGAQEIALDWLREAFASDVTVLDHALDDPLLFSLAPVLRTFHTQHSDHLRKILDPLLASEEALYNDWPNATTNAREALAAAVRTDWNDAPLGDLQEAVQEAIVRQLNALNHWSEELINDLLAAQQARTERNRLAEADARIPNPRKIDLMLEGVWPRLREKRDDLAAALRESERESMRLEKREIAIGDTLGTRLAAFLKCARRFEANTLQAPEQVSAINARAEMKAEPLRIATVSQLDHEGIVCHPPLLPEALAALTDEASEAPSGPALFRLEPHHSVGLVASRAGVYFQRAYRRSTPGQTR